MQAGPTTPPDSKCRSLRRCLLGLLQMPEREVFEYARQFVEMLRATEPEPEPEPS